MNEGISLKVELSQIARLIHYPDCWDTAVYPSLFDALNNTLDFNCVTCWAEKQNERGEKCEKINESILDPEELFWDELATECGFSPLAATSRQEFLCLIKGVIRQLEISENKIGEAIWRWGKCWQKQRNE